MNKKEIFTLLLILVVASFFRLYNPDITPGIINNAKIFYITAVFGILTVAGLYLLTREIFNWQTAGLVGFLTAISSWHANLSKTEPYLVLALFFLVFGFYFLWRGLKRNHISDFILAGILGGFGYYTHEIFWLSSIIAIILFINYWFYLKKDFSLSKYEYARNKLLQGFAAVAITVIVLTLPLDYYIWSNQDKFLEIIRRFFTSLGQNPLANLVPMISLPFIVLFAAGLIREFIHWAKRKHGHFSTVHTFLLAWLVVGVLPAALTNLIPGSPLMITALPAIMILAGRGLWWIFEKLNEWYIITTPHADKENLQPILVIALFIFLVSLGFSEYSKYFLVF